MEILVLTASVWSQHRYENCVYYPCQLSNHIGEERYYEFLLLLSSFCKFIAYNLIEANEKNVGFWGKLTKAE